METSQRRSRLLGWAFVFQFVTSFTSMALFLPLATGVQGLAGGSPEIGRVMTSMASNSTFVYLNILGELLTAAGVIFLGALLCRELRKVYEGLALTAWGLYVVEAALLAVGRIVLYSLLLLSQEYVTTGSPPAMEPLGRMLYEGMTYTSTVFNFLFCLGGTIFYALLFRSALVPRALSLWGLVGVSGVLVGTTISLFDARPSVFFFLAYIPFELAIGVWILLRGLNAKTVTHQEKS